MKLSPEERDAIKWGIIAAVYWVFLVPAIGYLICWIFKSCM